MDIDDNEVVSSSLNANKVITAVTCNQMCHNSLFRKKVPVNAESRSSRGFVLRKEGTKDSKAWSQRLNSLKIFILPVHFLKT